jgi:hypothetical protein
MTISQVSQSKDSSSDHKPTLGHAVLDYLRTADGVKKLVFELFSSVSDWLTLFSPNDQVSAVSTNVKQMRSFLSISKVPEELVKAAQQAHNLYEERTASNFGQLINRISSFLVQATDVADAVNQRVYPLSTRAVQAIGLVGNGALAIAGAFDLGESIQKVQEASNPALKPELSSRTREKHAVHGMFNGAAAVGDIAVGTLSVANLTSMLTVAPWVLLFFSTQTLLSTIGGRFYSHIHRI